VGALVAELALRTVYTIPEVADPLYSCYDSDPVLGWHGRPNVRMRFRRADFDVLVEHDADGWRRAEPPPPAGATRRVLVLGDSLAWGRGVEQGAVFSDLLQQRLSGRTMRWRCGSSSTPSPTTSMRSAGGARCSRSRATRWYRTISRRNG
jgi:hypothetical protein